MTLRVVGAGLGRTGTLSLKGALEQLLGGRCYHMAEVFANPGDHPVLRRAADGESVDWRGFLEGWSATVDWPTCSWWREISAAFPDALILLSTRDSFDTWYRSATATIFHGMHDDPERSDDWYLMMKASLSKHFTWPLTDRDTDVGRLRDAYERHNAAVRAEAPPDRLLEWQPGDGWEPICARLGLPVPGVPFPHHNTTAQFRERFATPRPART